MKQIILLCGLLFLTGCQQTLFTNEETLEIQLPVWPPEDDYKNQYPELSRWLLKTGNCSTSSLSYLAPTTTSITLTVEKNQPFCGTLQPITKNYSVPDTEAAYFHPAGFIYPFPQTKNKVTSFTWSKGFLANTMLTIIKSRNETGITAEHINTFLGTFNWNKAQESIDKKIESSVQAQVFYNPWLIDSATFLENLCYGNFKTTLLTPSGCYTYTLESLFPEKDLTPISPFIPENTYLKEKAQISIKKNTPTLLSDGKYFGAIITSSSSKKVSKEYIYLPIYIEDI